MCPNLYQKDAEELQTNVNRILRGSHSHTSNLNRAELQAIRELKRDKSRMILTANEGVDMVVMDRQVYKNKSNGLLAHPAYIPIPKDPTNKIRSKLITLLGKFKKETGLDNDTYKCMHPMGCNVPKFYGLLKIHKLDTSLRSIVSSRGLVTYGVVKVLTNILKPLVGRPPHHIHSTQDFVEQANKVTLLPGECLSSYDITALFISGIVEPALSKIKDLLEKDNTLKKRTVLQVRDIILLLEFCLHNTYFSLHGQFYEQVEGAAMRCPVNSIVSILYIEYFKQKTLGTATQPLKCDIGIWMTHLSSKRKITNKTSLNMLIALTQPESLQWKTTRRMVPSPSWIPLSNQKPMVDCLLQYIESLLSWISIYSGTVTITYQPNIV